MKFIPAKLLRKLPWRRTTPDAAHLARLVEDTHALITRLKAGELRPADLVSPHDVRFDVDDRWVKRMMASPTLHDEDYVLFSHFRDPATRVLDVGANRGYSVASMRAAGCLAHITSFEVSEAFRSSLERVKEIEGDRYDFHLSGVGAEPATLDFFIPVVNGLTISALTTGNPAQLHVDSIVENVVHYTKSNIPDGPYDIRICRSAARVDRLDRLLGPGSRVVAAKVDVEGLELEALSGAIEMLSRDTPLLLIEGGNFNDGVKTFLSTLGYFVAARDGAVLHWPQTPPDTVNAIFIAAHRLPEYAEMGLWRDAGRGPDVAAATAVSDRRCPCGGRMGLLVQSGREIERHWRGRAAPALACSRCCHVAFVPPSETELEDYYRTEYGKGGEDYYTYERDHEDRRVRSRAKLAEELAAAFQPGREDAVILELGCAFGGPVSELRRRGRNAFGLDLNSRAIAEGRSRGNTHLFDVPPSEFRAVTGTTADVVYSFHMLEHVRDLPAYLAGLHEVLSEGGIALFRVPNGAYLRAWLQGFDTWDWFAFPDHLHMLSPASAAALVDSCGFELVGLKSNVCGEDPEALATWLRAAVPGAVVTDAAAAVRRLADAGCLMELEFVLRKPGGTQPPDLMNRKIAAQTFAAQAAAAEAAIRQSPVEFARRCLS